ncbi:putative secreted protein with PEP-CTERM sorting signal [Roseiarcus fermentans]|uniref:Putative secreted protein with PEP-CTERM sorting signal n=1 Tax=Roseiarcus fermentans TaxID=1473586 RepID=A0A366FHA0_9HYPH|nr:PEP-CTERM sorting domain-containing protein [Roseiarcus fermentans]RBP14052.1 putative secreted protein with PEP-CTERM sorting signal [Roseiarcus fermentans]
MKKMGFLACAAIMAGIASAGAANAATFDLTFTNGAYPSNAVCCGLYTVTAVLQATQDGANYDVTSITGTVTTNSGANSYTIEQLASPPTTSDGYYGFDNVLLPSAGGYTLSNGGIAFYASAPVNPGNTAGPNGWSSYNIFLNTDNSIALTNSNSNNVNSPFEGTLTIVPAPAPEPATWAMMLLGMIGLGLTAYRRPSLKSAV